MFININNLKIHYTICTTENDNSIRQKEERLQNFVIMPGWGCSVNVYQKIQQSLMQKYNCRIYAIDLPGQGLSPPPLKPFGTEDYVNIFKQFIQNLHINQPIVLGHSLGGKIALYASGKGLVAIKKLILIDSAGIKSSFNLRKEIKKYIYKSMKFLANLPILRIKLLPIFLAYKNKLGSQDYRNAHGIMRQTLVTLVNEDWRNLLPNITTPTLLIWGEKDEATPIYQAQIMRKFIPNSQLVIIPNAGHFPFLDNFDLFIQNIEDFCDA